jgi:hypothetical protein
MESNQSGRVDEMLGLLSKYFDASRWATLFSLVSCSCKNCRTREGLRFDSSRNHQPIAFWITIQCPIARSPHVDD